MDKDEGTTPSDDMMKEEVKEMDEEEGLDRWGFPLV